MAKLTSVVLVLAGVSVAACQAYPHADTTGLNAGQIENAKAVDRDCKLRAHMIAQDKAWGDTYRLIGGPLIGAAVGAATGSALSAGLGGSAARGAAMGAAAGAIVGTIEAPPQVPTNPFHMGQWEHDLAGWCLAQRGYRPID